MNFWTKEKLIEAYPYCKIYNMPNGWSSLGLKIWHEDFELGNIALLRFEGDKRGIIKPNWDLIMDKSSALICSKGNAENIIHFGKPVIEVDDTGEVILAYAKYIRGLYTGKVIGITGSAGKSTTTGMVHDILKICGVSSNLNKANTSWGIGWNMTNFSLENPYWVIETSVGGGMIRNSALTKPDIAVITTIAPVHLTGTQTLRDIAFMKSKIFSSMEEGGSAIIYREIPYFDIFEDMALERKLKLITVGENIDSDIRIIAEDSNIIRVCGCDYKIDGELLPKHILFDMGMAVAASMECGISPKEAIDRLKNFKSLCGRGEVFEGRITPDKKITLVDESYNANPVSMKSALEGFCRVYGADEKTRVLVLGEMTEAGKDSLKYHLDLEETIRKVEPARILLCGNEMKPLWDILKFDFAGEHYANVDDLNKDILNWIKDGDYIFIKSSNSIGLHKTAALIQNAIS